jgi:hypothetical protein
MKTVFVSLLFLATGASAFSQAPDTLWTRTYGSTASERCYAMATTSDDGFILVGEQVLGYSHVYAVRVDGTGSVVWEQSYLSGPDTRDMAAHDVLQTPDGGFLMVGVFGMLKVSGSGQQEWFRAITGVALRSVVAVGSSSYAVFGWTLEPSPYAADYYFAVTDTQGFVVLQETYHFDNYDIAVKLVPANGGGYVFVGNSYSENGAYEVRVCKLDSIGNVLWARGFANNEGYSGAFHAFDMCRTDNGYVAVGGAYEDFWMLSLNENGDSLWSRTHGIVNHVEQANSVITTDDGGFLLAGTRWGDPDNIWVVKTDGIGNHVWDRLLQGLGYEGIDVAQTGNRQIAVAGNLVRNNTWDFFLIMLAPDIPLPVELASFSAISFATGIRLAWVMASETDNDHFEILRSTSEAGEFAQIAVLPSQGNTATGHSYEYLDRNVTAGQTYWYYLADVDLSGNRTEHRDMMRSATALGSAATPEEYTLTAYPNPFNPQTTIAFALPEAQQVRLAVFDVAGRLVRELANASFTAGRHHVLFNAGNLPTGVYIARIESAGFVKSEKLLLLK